MFTEERIARLMDFSQGKNAGPISIHLDLTNRCNQRCRFCWQRSHERIGLYDTDNELPDEKVLRLVDEAAALGVKDWLISGGGEPMLRTELCMQVMERIKGHGIFGDIITNGTFINEERARKIVEIGWDRLRVSLNGPTAELHDFLVDNEGAYDKAVRGLEMIQHYKKKFGTDKPDVGFNSVINSFGYRKFTDLIRLLKRLGGVLINTQTIILYDEPEKRYTLTPEQQIDFRPYCEECIALCRKYNIHTNLPEYLQDVQMMETSNELGQMDEVMITDRAGFESAHCYEPWYLATIRANGIVGSCRLFGDPGTDIHNHSLEEVWFGEYFQTARERIINNDMPDYCRHCNANEVFENNKIREAMLVEMEKERGGVRRTAAQARP